MEIYALRDPATLEIRYIGKANSAASRYKQHIKDRETNVKKVQWINELARAGVKPELVILETVDVHNWQEKERQWIEYGREIGWPLLNISPGGGGINWGVNWDECLRCFSQLPISEGIDKSSIAYLLATFALNEMMAYLIDKKRHAPEWLHDVGVTLIETLIDLVGGFSGKDVLFENKIIENVLMSIVSNRETRIGAQIYVSASRYATGLIVSRQPA